MKFHINKSGLYGLKGGVTLAFEIF